MTNRILRTDSNSVISIPVRIALSYVLTIFLLINFVDGSLPQLEIFLTRGFYPIPAGITKVFIAFLCFFGVLITQSRFNLKVEGSVPILLFIAYFLMDSFFLAQKYDFSYILFSFENYYFYLLLTLGILVFRPHVADKFWRYLLLMITIPLCIIGIFQHYLNDPILSTSSRDGFFVVPAYRFFGQQRAFSLFGNSGSFGTFLCIAGCFYFHRLLIVRNVSSKLSNFMLFSFVSYVVPMTFSRSVYYEYICALAACFFIHRRQMTLLRWLPLYYGLAGVCLAFSIPVIQGYFGTSVFGVPIFDDSSAKERLAEWATTFGLVFATPISTLIGTGIITSYQTTKLYSGTVDNIFLAVLLHIGVFGLFIYVLTMDRFWKLSSSILRTTVSSFTIACFSTFSTWSILGMFTIDPFSFPLVFILGVISSGYFMLSLKKN